MAGVKGLPLIAGINLWGRDMGDVKIIGLAAGKRGHTVAPTKIQNGYIGPTGTLGTPPTTGSAVSKPPVGKKT